MRIVSQILSYTFHPFLMPIYGLLLLFYLPTNPVSYLKSDALYHFDPKAKQIFLIVLGVLTFVAPALSLMIMRLNKMITSLKLENRRERIYPYTLVSFYFILSYIYVRYQIPYELMHPALLGFLFGILVALVVAFIINYIGIKISLHAVGTFGLCGAILAYNQTQLPIPPDIGYTNLSAVLLIFVTSGMVCTSRVYLAAHSLKEVVLGMLTGFLILYFCVRYGLFI